MFHVPESARVRHGAMRSDGSYGNNGAFVLRPRSGRRTLYIIASDGEGWEHVSVHVGSPAGLATPTWEEMCLVKETFWDPEDVVMQLHPRRSQYVNNHPHTLHLWRPIDAVIPEPPASLVGIVGGPVSNLARR